MRLFKSFDKGGDHPSIVIVDEIIEVFLDGGARLITAGDDVAQADVAVEHQCIGYGRAESAALRNQRYRAGKKSLGNRRSKERRFAENIQDAVAIRAADQKAAFAGERFKTLLALFPFGAGLSESGGENNRRAHAGVRRGIQQIRYMTIGHGQYNAIDGLGNRCYIGVTRAIQDLSVFRINRNDFTGIAETL